MTVRHWAVAHSSHSNWGFENQQPSSSPQTPQAGPNMWSGFLEGGVLCTLSGREADLPEDWKAPSPLHPLVSLCSSKTTLKPPVSYRHPQRKLNYKLHRTVWGAVVTKQETWFSWEKKGKCTFSASPPGPIPLFLWTWVFTVKKRKRAATINSLGNIGPLCSWSRFLQSQPQQGGIICAVRFLGCSYSKLLPNTPHHLLGYIPGTSHHHFSLEWEL